MEEDCRGFDEKAIKIKNIFLYECCCALLTSAVASSKKAIIIKYKKCSPVKMLITTDVWR